MSGPLSDLLEAVRKGLLVDGMLRRADLRGAHLAGCNLAGQDLSGADLRGANLTGANLTGARLFATHLEGAELRGANLSRVEASGARFTDANLAGADLRMADLTGADLRSARVVRANLAGADLSGADCFAALWTGTDLSRTNPEDALLFSRRAPAPDARPEHAEDIDSVVRRVLGLHERAWALIHASELEAALPILEECCRLVPDYHTLHVSRASLLVRLGRVEAGEAAYRRALEIVPDYDEALLNLARLVATLGRYEEAPPLLEQVLPAGGRSELAARRLLVELHTRHLGRPDLAIPHLRALIPLTRRDPAILERLARLLANTDQPDEAIELFEEVLRHRPEDPFLLRDVGLLYAVSGDRGEALATLQEAYAINPDIPNLKPQIQVLTALEQGTLSAPPDTPRASPEEMLSHFAPGSYLHRSVLLAQWAEAHLSERLSERLPDLAPFTFVALLGPGQDGVVAHLHCARGDVIAKGYLQRIVQRSELDARLAFTHHLAQSDLPVPDPLLLEPGTRSVSLEGAHWILMPRLEGEALPREEIARRLPACQALGAALARLHDAAVGFTPPVDFEPTLAARVTIAASRSAADTLEWQIGRSAEALTAFNARLGTPRLIERVAKHARLVASVARELPTAMVHGDPAPRNLLWSPDGDIAAILDFDLAAPAPMLLDIALALESVATDMNDLRRSRRVVVDRDASLALLAGYESVRPLTPSERLALPSLRRLAFVDRLVDAAVLAASEQVPALGLTFDILEAIVMARRND